MADPDRIYLQPECCASPDVGRMWSTSAEPVDCIDGVPWTEYVRADVVDELAEEGAQAIQHALEARNQRDGLRLLLRSVYRRLRDGREVSHSQMEALRICYDRRRSVDSLSDTGGET